MGWAPYDRAVSSIGDALSKIADLFKTCKDKQLETEVIKENKRQDKALRAVNKALDLVSPYIQCLPLGIEREFEKQKEIFDKNFI